MIALRRKATQGSGERRDRRVERRSAPFSSRNSLRSSPAALERSGADRRQDQAVPSGGKRIFPLAVCPAARPGARSVWKPRTGSCLFRHVRPESRRSKRRQVVEEDERPRFCWNRIGVRGGERERARWRRSLRFQRARRTSFQSPPSIGGRSRSNVTANCFGERMMPLGEAVPCPIRIRGAAEESAGEHCDASEPRLERRDSAWAHTAARRAIKRVFA